MPYLLIANPLHTVYISEGPCESLHNHSVRYLQSPQLWPSVPTTPLYIKSALRRFLRIIDLHRIISHLVASLTIYMRLLNVIAVDVLKRKHYKVLLSVTKTLFFSLWNRIPRYSYFTIQTAWIEILCHCWRIDFWIWRINIISSFSINYSCGIPGGTFIKRIMHSCEKLKHRFYEVSSQNERKGCFDAALAPVAVRRLYLMILRFFEFFWLSFWVGTPTSDNFQKSKEKPAKISISSKRCSGQPWNSCHLWLSFGYLFELAVSDENYSLLFTPKV